MLEQIDAEAGRAAGAAILITVPYHVRSAEQLRDRIGSATTIHGHRGCLKRLGPSAPGFREIDPEAELPGGARAFFIGKPRRNEHPIYLPGHEAIVFGDAVAGHGGRLRVWAHDKIDERVRRFYRDRFNPTLEPLHDLGAERILTTHGAPVLEGGAAALRAATDAEPWYHHG